MRKMILGFAVAIMLMAASAQAQGAVWSATFTPGDINGYAFGCRNGDDDAECSNPSILSDDEFTVDGVVYTVTEFYQTSGTNRLYFAGIRTPEDGTSWVDIADELKIGSTSLDIGYAFLSQGQNNTSAWRLRWSGDPGLDDVLGGESLTDGTDISVTLISDDLPPPPPPPTAPGAPTGLAATANGPSQIDLAWTAPATTGGSAITGYNIEVSPNGTSGWTDQVANTGNANTTYAHTGLTAGTTRHYRVSAINANGTGVPSNVDSATTGTTVPGAPTGLTATASGTTQIDLAWTAPASTGGSAITGYKIEVSPDGSSWSDLVADTNSTATTYAHTGLTAGDTRHYRVSAINAVGTSDASESDDTTTTASTNTAATGAPTITGTAQVGETLTASTTGIADANGLTTPGYTYQWIRVATDNTETNISSATASTYTLVAADQGTTIKVTVSFTDDASNAETLTSAATVTVTTTPGAPTGLAATANGPSQIDLAWTAPASTGGSAITGYNIEVSANGTSGWTDQVANTGNANTTYAHTGLTAGTTRHYRVSAINANGTGVPSNVDSATTGTTVPGAPTGLTATASGTTQIDLAWTAPASTGGSAITGYKIEVSPDGSSWSDLVADTNSTATTYAHTGLTAGDTRHYRVSAINAVGTSDASESDDTTTTASTNTAATGAPTITGTAQVGETLTASTTGIADANGLTTPGYTYQWIRVATDNTETNISSATASTYTLVAADQGTTIKVTVSFTDDASNAETLTSAATAAVAAAPNTLATGAPTITGTAQVGETLTASTTGIADANGLTTPGYTYQWIRVNGTEADIAGENSSTYTLVDADLGTTLKVKVSFTDDASNSETLTSAATAAVSAAANTLATGAPTITGTATVGQPLTAGTTAIMDADGLTSVSYTYQWIRVATDNTETNISSATASTYTLVAADQGTTVKVTVSFTDDANNPETRTSAATATVSAAANTLATGAPTITGTVQVGQTLTASTTGIADANGLTTPNYTYQWIRVDGTDEADIASANSSTYTLVAADLGTTLKVRVTFADDLGHTETLTSAATATVTATPAVPTREPFPEPEPEPEPEPVPALPLLGQLLLALGLAGAGAMRLVRAARRP